MYLLINREGIVVDALDRPRYIKLIPQTGIVIACEDQEGTGVIGSDANTHYPLIRSDTTNNPNAVTVMEIDKLTPDIKIDKTRLNPNTGKLEPRYSLAEVQAMKQEENKAAFAAYLASHPLTWTDGKEYGITEEDQNEINLNLARYQIAVQNGTKAPVLEWHARHEKSTSWSVEQLTALSLAISAEVYPYYHQMQEYKTRIFDATSIDEVESIECVFSPVN